MLSIMRFAILNNLLIKGLETTCTCNNMLYVKKMSIEGYRQSTISTVLRGNKRDWAV